MRGQVVATAMNTIRLRKPQLLPTNAASRESTLSSSPSLAELGQAVDDERRAQSPG